ncbi:Uronate isomerase [Fusobacterium sp. DD29]|uniref:glucuronate isomerase n=1 Tax=unclassified Fusobacterium TaxID=2648384 RepID=UPI001B8B9DF0|nr:MULTISPECIES: glucuronate isomerase [unclassified Fusobacterium]MBR8748608.1 Uronate isomerase [Fusobacterium sp. DD29]MBR8760928.1 Uronate isomerase [Fusobacterium sp. DD25]MBR8766940.1 Uronate isomerase [Fusobacterium sp. DD43]MBR8770888.1 Uronate isomerase [Fusobacterium sp. DD40]MBR8775163.1 Uronate isomerase [Fusobacterium sp. DD17]
MRKFMCDDFLLMTETAKRLYHDYAKHMPIYDYHCHLNPKEIYENKKYKNITEVWLGGDHYKWRAMRSNGVDEKYITGDADDKEKFIKWAETVDQCYGNPLFHWTHLELKRFFGIDLILSKETAEEIWNLANEKLSSDDFRARNLIEMSNVKVICTTDDPIDSLEYHIALKKDTTFKTIVNPAFRPDKGIRVEKEEFIPWFNRLEEIYGEKIDTIDKYTSALANRIDFFHEVGCRISDHALDPVVFAKASKEEVNAILLKKLSGEELTENEVKQFKTYIMIFLGKEYNKRNWVMQIHTGCIRNVSTNMFNRLGPDTGFDAIGDKTYINELASLLDAIDITNELPKTILYNLNPRDNEAIGALIGCFQDGKTPGKIQFGSGWWFLDQKDGIIRQMTALANLGLLSRFVGMLTDSRSFLSYTRHEYFRRILCNLLGEWVENGELPNDLNKLGKMIENICFNNIDNYIAK